MERRLLQRATLVIEVVRQDPMNNQIGIAANGRGEVRVAWRGEGEVAGVHVAITRLFQRPQHEVTEDSFLWPPGDPGDQFLIVSRGNAEVFARQHHIAPRLAPIAMPLHYRKPLYRQRANT